MRLRMLLTFLVATAAPAAAQVEWLPVPEDTPRREGRRPQVGEWQFGFDAGFANYIPGVFRERGSRIVVFAERQVHRALALQADGNCSRGAKRRVTGQPQEIVSLCSGVLSAVIPFELHHAIWPYARVGYGVSLWDERVQEGYYDVDDSSPTWVLAAGFRAYLGAEQKVGLRVDVQRQETTLRALRVPHWSFGLGMSLRVPRGVTFED